MREEQLYEEHEANEGLAGHVDKAEEAWKARTEVKRCTISVLPVYDVSIRCVKRHRDA